MFAPTGTRESRRGPRAEPRDSEWQHLPLAAELRGVARIARLLRGEPDHLYQAERLQRVVEFLGLVAVLLRDLALVQVDLPVEDGLRRRVRPRAAEERERARDRGREQRRRVVDERARLPRGHRAQVVHPLFPCRACCDRTVISGGAPGGLQWGICRIRGERDGDLLCLGIVREAGKRVRVCIGEGNGQRPSMAEYRVLACGGQHVLVNFLLLLGWDKDSTYPRYRWHGRRISNTTHQRYQ